MMSNRIIHNQMKNSKTHRGFILLLIYTAFLVDANEETEKISPSDVGVSDEANHEKGNIDSSITEKKPSEIYDQEEKNERAKTIDNLITEKESSEIYDQEEKNAKAKTIDNVITETESSEISDQDTKEKEETIDNAFTEKEPIEISYQESNEKENNIDNHITETESSETHVQQNNEKENHVDNFISEKKLSSEISDQENDEKKNAIDSFPTESESNDHPIIEDEVPGDIVKPIIINQVKVIQDNVTGHKGNAFSEMKSENRDNDITLSQVTADAERRILEKENTLSVDGDEEINSDKVPGDDQSPDLLKDEIEAENKVDKNSDMDEIKSDSESFNDVEEPAVAVDSHPTNKVNIAADENESSGTDSFSEGSENIPLEPEIGEQPVEVDSSSESVFHEKNNGFENTPVGEEASLSEKTETSKEEVGKMNDLKESSSKEVKAHKGTNIPDSSSKSEVDLGEKIYNEAMELFKGGKGNKKKAYKLFAEAADLNNIDASKKIAYPLLFGDDIRRNITKAIGLFHRLAERGDPLGQQGLGFIYGAGINANSSQAKALIYTTFGALGGDALAQMMLGYRYMNGIGVAKSCESALTYYKKVAKKVADETTSHGGNAVQRVRLYDELEQPGGTSGQIDEDLLQYYQFLADKGDLQAQVGLGQLYFQGGRGIDINYEKAFKYFQLAANMDNGNGLAYLGKMYLDGLHVEKDEKKAFDYFAKAVEQSNPIGQAGLGMIYLNGAGVKKDYDQAMKYFSQAAEQGWVEGQLQLGNMFYKGTGVKKDHRQAVKYFTFASQSGHVMAFYNLASMHATGAGVVRSCSYATELFKNVAERGKWAMMFMDAYDSYRAGDLETALLKYYYLAELGYEVAQSNVAYVLEKGEIVWFSQNQTYARSLLQWSRAAHQGYAVARVKVGDYYFYGYGTAADYDAAALHYRMASDQQNNPQAMFNLGYMHEKGFGLKKDIHLAKRFYDMASEASPDAHFPVTLAILKLTFYFTWEWIQKNYRFWKHPIFQSWWLFILQKLGPDWDMYLITALALLLGGLLLFRRNLRR